MRKKIKYLIIIGILILVFFISLKTGKYPLSFEKIITGDSLQLKVFLTLRLPRTCMGIIGGIGLGIAGMIYQTVFSNPLASPDIVGVSSGASVGAAIAILFLVNNPLCVTTFAFMGSIIAILLSLLISALASHKGNISIVLSGLIIHSLSQTVLMILKTIADPEQELAAIEYWIMGSLNAITLEQLPMAGFVVIICSIVLILLYRQVLLLSLDDGEAMLLGVHVRKMRLLILLLATLMVASIVSVTGIISFVGLLAPHIGRMFIRENSVSTLVLSGAVGGIILGIADILSRSISGSELPVSVFTSLIGAPFLLILLLDRSKSYE